jgi:hypothetical protein
MNTITTNPSAASSNPANVIMATARFCAQKCPVGGMALHPEFGVVEIMAANEDRREVRYDIIVPLTGVELTSDLPASVTADEILSGEQITYHCADVHVTSLREMDVRRDIGSGVPSGWSTEDDDAVAMPASMP